MSEQLYYVVSVKHTQREQRYITVWRPEDKGYAWPLSWAGRYPESHIAESLDYYNDGGNIAVPCGVLDRASIAPAPGQIDNDAGPVVLNNRANWQLILNSSPWPLAAPAKPEYKGARRCKESRT